MDSSLMSGINTFDRSKRRMEEKIEGLINKVILIVFVLVIIIGCGMPIEQVENLTRESMQQSFDTDAQFVKWHMTVSSIQVLKQGHNHYQGIAKVSLNGEFYTVPVDIITDGSKVMWKAESGAFNFLAEIEQQQRIQEEQRIQQQMIQEQQRIIQEGKNRRNMRTLMTPGSNPLDLEF